MKKVFVYLRMELVKLLWWNKDVIVIWPEETEGQFDSDLTDMNITGGENPDLT